MSVSPCFCCMKGVRARRYRLGVIGLLVLALMGASAPVRADGNGDAFTPPESDQWVRVEPLERLEGFRAFITPFVMEGELGIRMERGRKAPSFTHELTIADAEGKSLPVRILEEKPPAPHHPVHALRIDASDWSDGVYDITLRLIPDRGAGASPADSDASTGKDASPSSAPGTGNTDSPQGDAVTILLCTEVVQAAFASMEGQPHRDELATWVRDHNRQRAIWSVIPTWTNLTAAIRNAIQGDPYAGLRGFLLRAYFNPQLKQMQPYTVYVPDALDLDHPAPLLILLHGSGGDYRNLVADHASGQRFEEHPMLIANAGAFGHLEFRHLALNDVRWVIEDMKRKYNIDPDRIYCQGVSLGGRGVLELASRMPEMFAGVCSQGVYGVMPNLLDPQWIASVDPVRLRVELRKDIRSLLPHMHHVPVELFVQLQDTVTPPVNALLIGSWLHHHRREIPDAAPVSIRTVDTAHNLTLPEYDWASTRAWFLQHTRREAIPAPPSAVPAPQGPIWTVWQTPVLYAYDDTGDEEIKRRLRSSAKKSAMVGATFGRYTFPVRAWGELTVEEKGAYSIILFRASESAADFGMENIPWPDDSEAVRKAVAESTFRLALRPSPWSEAHRVLVVMVDGRGAVNLNLISMWDSAFQTDWVVGRMHRWERFSIAAVGDYDADWNPLPDGHTLDDPRGSMVLRH